METKAAKLLERVTALFAPNRVRDMGWTAEWHALMVEIKARVRKPTGRHRA